jgi:hypothetical protein
MACVVPEKIGGVAIIVLRIPSPIIRGRNENLSRKFDFRINCRISRVKKALLLTTQKHRSGFVFLM